MPDAPDLDVLDVPDEPDLVALDEPDEPDLVALDEPDEPDLDVVALEGTARLETPVAPTPPVTAPVLEI